jgi:hypothetical protein
MQAVDEKLDFDKVWAAIQATNEQLKETDKRVGAITKLLSLLANTFTITEPAGKYHPHEW